MKIQSQAAVLLAGNLTATIKYWNEQIGFAIHGSFGEPVQFAIVERDRAFVMLRQAQHDQTIEPYWQRNEGVWNAYFWVDDVNALFEELRRRAAIIDYPLCDQSYGVREFAVRDPDRQSIGFGQVLGTANGAPPA